MLLLLLDFLALQEWRSVALTLPVNPSISISPKRTNDSNQKAKQGLQPKAAGEPRHDAAQLIACYLFAEGKTLRKRIPTADFVKAF